MKRLSLLFAAIVLSSMTATAQNKVGEFSLRPMVGINVSDISGCLDIESFDAKKGFTGGVEAEVGLTPWLGISLGIMYSQQGAKYFASVEDTWLDEADQEVPIFHIRKGTLKADYINLPLLANFYIWKGLAMKTGFQVGFNVRDNFDTQYGTGPLQNDKTYHYDASSPRPSAVVRGFLSDKEVCKSIDFGIPVGISFEYRNVVIDARYYFGLKDMDDTFNPKASHNRYLSITLGYKFKL